MGSTKWLGVGSLALVAATTLACSSSSSTPSGSSGSASQGKLYDRLGGNAGIAKAVDAIVKEELKDPEIASYFVFQTNAVAGHPTPAQIEACLTNQLGNAAGGPEAYPTEVAGGFQCRSMHAAHAQLGIPNGVFEKFVTIAAGVLKGAGVADEDIKTVGSVLEGTKADVAQDTSRDGGSFNKQDGG